MVLGVCKGLADYFDFSVFWMRFITVGVMLMTGLWPTIGLYIIAGLLMKPKPVAPLTNDREKEFYHSYAHQRPMAVKRLKRTFENLDRRLRRLEDIVTAKEFDWNRRFKQG